MTRPAPSHPSTARRSSGSAASRADRDSTSQTSPSASAAAMARTRQSVSGATASQQAGTALATMAGWKLKKAAATGPAPTRAERGGAGGEVAATRSPAGPPHAGRCGIPVRSR